MSQNVPADRRAQLIVILSNAPDVLLAKRIAHILVEEGLAACVNLGAPGLSIYAWAGQIEGAQEIPLVIKTTLDRQAEAVSRLVELHPYDVPEVLVLQVAAATPEYGAWVHEHTRGPMPGEVESNDVAGSM